MARPSKENHVLLLLIVGLSSWLIPGAGYFLLKEKKRAIIIFTAVVLTFCAGLYVGSIGVVDAISGKMWSWYTAQIIASPIVAVIGHLTATGLYPVYGRPNEIGQIYTSIAGLLNLLCIINAVYLVYLRRVETAGD